MLGGTFASLLVLLLSSVHTYSAYAQSQRTLVTNGALSGNFIDVPWSAASKYQQTISDGSKCAVVYTQPWGAWSIQVKKNGAACTDFHSCEGKFLVLELGPGTNTYGKTATYKTELAAGVFGQGQEYKKKVNLLKSSTTSNSHTFVSIDLSELNSWTYWDRVFVQNYANKNLNIVICNAYITSAGDGFGVSVVSSSPDVYQPSAPTTYSPSGGLSNPVVLYTVGDSTTDWGSWRYKLVQKIKSWGYQVQTTGSKTDGYGLKHDGHASKKSSDILGYMYSWMMQDWMWPKPTVITLLIGVNDLRAWRNPWSAAEDVKKIVGLMFQRHPNALVLLASTMKYNSQIWGGDSNQVSVLNSLYVSHVLNYYKGQGRKIDYVDLYNKVPADQIGDKLHPNINDWGAQLMADGFFEVLSKHM